MEQRNAFISRWGLTHARDKYVLEDLFRVDIHRFRNYTTRDPPRRALARTRTNRIGNKFLVPRELSVFRLVSVMRQPDRSFSRHRYTFYPPSKCFGETIAKIVIGEDRKWSILCRDFIIDTAIKYSRIKCTIVSTVVGRFTVSTYVLLYYE